MKRPLSAHEERRRLLGEASRHFLRAAAVLTEEPVGTDGIMFTTLEGALGMLRLAEADADCRAIDGLMAYLQEKKAGR